jgi:hypothetical protein
LFCTGICRFSRRGHSVSFVEDSPSRERGASNAGTSDNRTRTPRQTEGEISVNPSGRICPRGNSSRARRKTWREIGETSDCHWAVQSAARRSKTRSSEKRPRFEASEKAGQTRFSKGPRSPPQDFAGQIARSAIRTQAREPQHRVHIRTVAANSKGCETAWAFFVAPRCDESSTYQGPQGFAARGSQSGANTWQPLGPGNRCRPAISHRDK